MSIFDSYHFNFCNISLFWLIQHQIFYLLNLLLVLDGLIQTNLVIILAEMTPLVYISLWPLTFSPLIWWKIWLTENNNNNVLILLLFSPAKDMLTFMLRWYEKFSELKSKPLFLTGESYAGTRYISHVQYLILIFCWACAIYSG